jgi:hypothetical protein
LERRTTTTSSYTLEESRVNQENSPERTGLYDYQVTSDLEGFKTNN